MTNLRTAAQQALEVLVRASSYYDTYAEIAALEAALAEPTLQTCNCRWDGEVQVQQCTLHEAHVDAIHEWAERAKTAEKKLAALAEPVQEPVAWMHVPYPGNAISPMLSLSKHREPSLYAATVPLYIKEQL